MSTPDRPPLTHGSWCTEHPLDPNDPTYTGACFSDTLDIDFGERTHAGDAVDLASLFLSRPAEQTLLTVIGGMTSISLEPDQIRPLAMALLAYDALLTGDTARADYYRGEALRSETAGA
jgi:hypothetical protein